MEYGYFDAQAREYVIVRPDTPLPWYNYLRNDRYVAMISNTGGGPSYFDDARFKRVLRYRYNNVPADRPGRYIYVRDMDDGDFWSLQWAPVQKPTRKFRYRCRVGLNYQIIESGYKGIRSSVTYFVPPDAVGEIWLVRLKNASRRTRRLRTYSYAELAVWGTLRDIMNLDNNPRCTRLSYENGAVIHSTWNDIGTGLDNMKWVRAHAFIASTLEPSGWHVERDMFIGVARDESNPITVEKGMLPRYAEDGGRPAAVLVHDFELAPGEETEYAYIVTAGDDRSEAEEPSLRFRSLETCKKALQSVKEAWEETLSLLQARTPDPDFDIAHNVFNQYQATLTTYLSRSISPYEWGLGRGVGFRDTAQDLMGMCHAYQNFVKDRLRLLCSHLYPDGIATHNIFPLTGEGRGRDFYDDQNWLPISVCHYVKETGDTAFLDEELPFKNSGSGTVYEHLLRALDASWRLRGRNGLPQIGHADWNDGLNPRSMEAESVFNAMLFCYSARETAALARLLGKTKDAETLEARRSEIARTANEAAWDGAWYRRILYADGGYIGGKDQPARFGYIWLEPQPWAVMAGVAGPERGRIAMDAVYEHLFTPFGIRLHREPFPDYDPTIGSISILLPGTKENGSVFCHPNPWAVVAECVLGRGERAMELYRAISYASKNRIADIHATEPYVYSQHIYLPPHKPEGRAANPWLTGTAGWSMTALSQWILGVRPDWDGLRIDPCIPSSWKEFRVQRTYRGAQFRITVKNPDGVEKGVKAVRIGRRELDDNVIPPQEPGTAHQVTVVMG